MKLQIFHSQNARYDHHWPWKTLPNASTVELCTSDISFSMYHNCASTATSATRTCRLKECYIHNKSSGELLGLSSRWRSANSAAASSDFSMAWRCPKLAVSWRQAEYVIGIPGTSATTLDFHLDAFSLMVGDKSAKKTHNRQKHKTNRWHLMISHHDISRRPSFSWSLDL